MSEIEVVSEDGLYLVCSACVDDPKLFTRSLLLEDADEEREGVCTVEHLSLIQGDSSDYSRIVYNTYSIDCTCEAKYETTSPRPVREGRRLTV